MSRWARVVLVSVVAVVVLGAGTGARAAATGGAVCKPFSASGLTPRWSVIGNVSCSQAKPWLVKILADRGTPGARAVIKNAPKGFHCSATDDSKGRPAVGFCYTGTPSFPKNGFQWLA